MMMMVMMRSCTLHRQCTTTAGTLAAEHPLSTRDRRLLRCCCGLRYTLCAQFTMLSWQRVSGGGLCSRTADRGGRANERTNRILS